MRHAKKQERLTPTQGEEKQTTETAPARTKVSDLVDKIFKTTIINAGIPWRYDRFSSRPRNKVSQ